MTLLETILENKDNLKEDEWDNYSFYGDFEAEFNEYFEQLYDLVDTDKLI